MDTAFAFSYFHKHKNRAYSIPETLLQENNYFNALSRPCGLGVTCSPRDPKFAGSNPTEVDGFFSRRKNPEHKSSERHFKLGTTSLRFQVR